MSIRIVGLVGLFLTVGLILPTKASACRGVEPEELRDAKADAIVLAQIIKVESANNQWRRWNATATKGADVYGSVNQKEFTVVDEGPGGCGPGRPTIGGYWLFYLQKQGGAVRTVAAWPFWWGRRSGDLRLKRVNALLPLGIVRTPNAGEDKVLDLVEKTIRLSDGKRDLSNYTRIYSRSSPGSLRADFIRSRTPKRLVTDISEQGPTHESCKCKIDTISIDFEGMADGFLMPPKRP